MILSHSKKFIFVHNYKVAGTSIRRALDVYNFPSFRSSQPMDKLKLLLRLYPWVYANQFEGHSTAQDIRNRVPKKIYDSYFKFGFVRSPWDWQVSLYTYMLKLETHHRHDLVKSFENFDQYIEWRVNEDLHLQKDFFYSDGQCIVNKIGKYESLASDFQEICDQLGIEAELPKLNVSKKTSDYLSFYSQKSIDLVHEAFKEDIETFGYQKPEQVKAST